MGLFSSLRNAGLSGKDAVRGITRGLRQMSVYGDLAVEDSDNGLSVGRDNPPAAITCVGLGVIVATGDDDEDDFGPADPRYWVGPVLPLAAAATLTMPVCGTRGFACGDFWGIGTAIVLNIQEIARRPTNPATEQVVGCHLLNVGDFVWVYALSDDTGADILLMNERPIPRVRVKDSSGCGIGHYNGVVIQSPTADIDKSVDLTSADVGYDGPACIIRNRQEIGRTTDAWLTAADNTHQLEFGGQLVWVNADGTPVVEINAAWFDPCSTGSGDE